MAENVLYYGDNLDILRRYIKDETVDLIYLDPPFFSNRYYEIIWGDEAEIRSFEDRWDKCLYRLDERAGNGTAQSFETHWLYVSSLRLARWTLRTFVSNCFQRKHFSFRQSFLSQSFN